MAKKKKLVEQLPEKYPESMPIADPEDPLVLDEDNEIIPFEDPFETPPYTPPAPGEGP